MLVYLLIGAVTATLLACVAAAPFYRDIPAVQLEAEVAGTVSACIIATKVTGPSSC
jgi:hypothetical protein